jgi:general stress protein 26
MQASMQRAEFEQLREKIKDIKFVMLSTIEQDGDIHMRPMATHDVDQDGTLWFFTYDDSNKVREIRRNPRVGLGYENHSAETYVTAAGTAELVKDKAKIDQLWNDFLKAWFPEGKDDPRIALLKVSLHQAEYWDRPGGKMVTLFEMVKAKFTGVPDKSNKNEKFGSEKM